MTASSECAAAAAAAGAAVRAAVTMPRYDARNATSDYLPVARAQAGGQLAVDIDGVHVCAALRGAADGLHFAWRARVERAVEVLARVGDGVLNDVAPGAAWRVAPSADGAEQCGEALIQAAGATYVVLTVVLAP